MSLQGVFFATKVQGVSVEGSLSWESLSMGLCSGGVFVRGGLCSRGLPDRDCSDRDHPVQLEAAVRVLLE